MKFYHLKKFHVVLKCSKFKIFSRHFNILRNKHTTLQNGLWNSHYKHRSKSVPPRFTKWFNLNGNQLKYYSSFKKPENENEGQSSSPIQALEIQRKPSSDNSRTMKTVSMQDRTKNVVSNFLYPTKESNDSTADNMELNPKLVSECKYFISDDVIAIRAKNVKVKEMPNGNYVILNLKDNANEDEEINKMELKTKIFEEIQNSKPEELLEDYETQKRNEDNSKNEENRHVINVEVKNIQEDTKKEKRYGLNPIGRKVISKYFPEKNYSNQAPFGLEDLEEFKIYYDKDLVEQTRLNDLKNSQINVSIKFEDLDKTGDEKTSMNRNFSIKSVKPEVELEKENEPYYDLKENPQNSTVNKLNSIARRLEMVQIKMNQQIGVINSKRQCERHLQESIITNQQIVNKFQILQHKLEANLKELDELKVKIRELGSSGKHPYGNLIYKSLPKQREKSRHWESKNVLGLSENNKVKNTTKDTIIQASLAPKTYSTSSKTSNQRNMSNIRKSNPKLNSFLPLHMRAYKDDESDKQSGIRKRASKVMMSSVKKPLVKTLSNTTLSTHFKDATIEQTNPDETYINWGIYKYSIKAAARKLAEKNKPTKIRSNSETQLASLNTNEDSIKSMTLPSNNVIKTIIVPPEPVIPYFNTKDDRVLKAKGTMEFFTDLFKKAKQSIVDTKKREGTTKEYNPNKKEEKQNMFVKTKKDVKDIKTSKDNNILNEINTAKVDKTDQKSEDIRPVVLINETENSSTPFHKQKNAEAKHTPKKENMIPDHLKTIIPDVQKPAPQQTVTNIKPKPIDNTDPKKIEERNKIPLTAIPVIETLRENSPEIKTIKDVQRLPVKPVPPELEDAHIGQIREVEGAEEIEEDIKPTANYFDVYEGLEADEVMEEEDEIERNMPIRRKHQQTEETNVYSTSENTCLDDLSTDLTNIYTIVDYLDKNPPVSPSVPKPPPPEIKKESVKKIEQKQNILPPSPPKKMSAEVQSSIVLDFSKSNNLFELDNIAPSVKSISDKVRVFLNQYNMTNSISNETLPAKKIVITLKPTNKTITVYAPPNKIDTVDQELDHYLHNSLKTAALPRKNILNNLNTHTTSKFMQVNNAVQRESLSRPISILCQKKIDDPIANKPERQCKFSSASNSDRKILEPNSKFRPVTFIRKMSSRTAINVTQTTRNPKKYTYVCKRDTCLLPNWIHKFGKYSYSTRKSSCRLITERYMSKGKKPVPDWLKKRRDILVFEKTPCPASACVSKKKEKKPSKKKPSKSGCKLTSSKKDPCGGKDPCKVKKPSSKKDSCAGLDPCGTKKRSSKKDPCGGKDPCRTKKPTKKTKKNPCATKKRSSKKNPCATKKGSSKKNPCASKKRSAKKDPCATKKKSSKKDPCATKKGSSKKNPCATKKSSAKKDPCASKKRSAKKDPCATKKKSSKKDPCGGKDPCSPKKKKDKKKSCSTTCQKRKPAKCNELEHPELLNLCSSASNVPALVSSDTVESAFNKSYLASGNFLQDMTEVFKKYMVGTTPEITEISKMKTQKLGTEGKKIKNKTSNNTHEKNFILNETFLQPINKSTYYSILGKCKTNFKNVNNLTKKILNCFSKNNITKLSEIDLSLLLPDQKPKLIKPKLSTHSKSYINLKKENEFNKSKNKSIQTSGIFIQNKCTQSNTISKISNYYNNRTIGFKMSRTSEMSQDETTKSWNVNQNFISKKTHAFYCIPKHKTTLSSNEISARTALTTIIAESRRGPSIENEEIGKLRRDLIPKLLRNCSLQSVVLKQKKSASTFSNINTKPLDHSQKRKKYNFPNICQHRTFEDNQKFSQPKTQGDMFGKFHTKQEKECLSILKSCKENVGLASKDKEIFINELRAQKNAAEKAYAQLPQEFCDVKEKPIYLQIRDMMQELSKTGKKF